MLGFNVNLIHGVNQSLRSYWRSMPISAFLLYCTIYFICGNAPANPLVETSGCALSVVHVSMVNQRIIPPLKVSLVLDPFLNFSTSLKQTAAATHPKLTNFPTLFLTLTTLQPT